MSSAPGRVLPSGDQPPPWSAKYRAWEPPLEWSGSAKWYAPWIMPEAYEPLYCCAKYGFV